MLSFLFPFSFGKLLSLRTFRDSPTKILMDGIYRFEFAGYKYQKLYTCSSKMMFATFILDHDYRFPIHFLTTKP